MHKRLGHPANRYYCTSTSARLSNSLISVWSRYRDAANVQTLLMDDQWIYIVDPSIFVQLNSIWNNGTWFDGSTTCISHFVKERRIALCNNQFPFSEIRLTPKFVACSAINNDSYRLKSGNCRQNIRAYSVQGHGQLHQIGVRFRILRCGCLSVTVSSGSFKSLDYSVTHQYYSIKRDKGMER